MVLTMPKVLIDGVTIYYESHGEGFPLVLCHEFAGDYRSWEDQVRFFSRRYRVITYNARGYPPSDVPDDPDAYSQERSVEDLKGLLEQLGIESVHIGGLSMGGSVALHFGIKYPKLARSLIVAGAGTGSVDPDAFRRNANRLAQQMEAQGMQAMSDYAKGPVAFSSWRRTRWAGNGSPASSCPTPAPDRLARSGAFRPGGLLSLPWSRNSALLMCRPSSCSETRTTPASSRECS